jgi:UDP-2,3-diacylglucosamine pyrophosphatase LpxH
MTPSRSALEHPHHAFAPLEDEDAPVARSLRFRSIFISDCHLGTPGCQAGALLEFLRCTESDQLYLVGDIFDGWQLKRRWYWHQLHNDVVQKVLRKARKGTQVIYVPGNHDEAARQYIGVDFGGIAIREDATHVTADGRRLLVIHGDRFDGVIRYAKWMASIGDCLYTVVLKISHAFSRVRARLGLPYWSLSQFLKVRVKNAVSYITAFEDALAHEARTRGFDGVVCGHIHHAEIRSLGDTLYCNSGDWVESLTALVEAHDGTLSILRWQEVVAAGTAVTSENTDATDTVAAWS